jgi:hypothetical protein
MRLPVYSVGCNSSALHAEVDIQFGNCHTCDIHFATSASVSPIKKALERAGTTRVIWNKLGWQRIQ